MEHDLNKIYKEEIEMGLHDRTNNSLRVKWVNGLRVIVSRRMPLNKMGTPLTNDVDLLLAFPEERAEALLKIK